MDALVTLGSDTCSLHAQCGSSPECVRSTVTTMHELCSSTMTATIVARNHFHCMFTRQLSLRMHQIKDARITIKHGIVAACSVPAGSLIDQSVLHASVIKLVALWASSRPWKVVTPETTSNWRRWSDAAEKWERVETWRDWERDATSHRTQDNSVQRRWYEALEAGHCKPRTPTKNRSQLWTKQVQYMIMIPNLHVLDGRRKFLSHIFRPYSSVHFRNLFVSHIALPLTIDIKKPCQQHIQLCCFWLINLESGTRLSLIS